MSDFEKDIDKRIKQLLEIEDLDEMNVTGNIDGGEGPPRTPHAFKKSNGTDEEDEPDHDSIEVFDYKKAKKTNNFFESFDADTEFKKMALDMLQINEASYRDYKRNEDSTPKQKINKAIKEINTKLFELEKTFRQNVRLKQEMGVNNDQYWKSTKLKLEKIDNRLNRLSTMTRKFYE